MNYYRISKYDPQYRIEGIYQKAEWTSKSDIGKEYDGKVFTEDEYYKVEQSYVDFVRGVCNLQGIDHLTIADLENHNNLHWANGQQLTTHQSEEFIKLCLREEIWGRLVSKGFAFETGYEYYIHIGCELQFDEIEQLAHQNNLFVEEWEQFTDAHELATERIKVKGYSFKCENVFFVYLKKHYCPICSQKLARKKVSEIINSDSVKAKNYDFDIADNTVKGNVKFTHVEFSCSKCNKNYTVKEI